MVQLSLSPVISQNLFSQNYLELRLKELPDWLELKEHERAFDEIKGLYEREKGNFEQYNEAQLEDHFIKPVLRILGHAFEVQAESDRSASTPDYAFFPHEEARVEAHQLRGKKEFYSKAIAVGDAKVWGTPLDKKSSKRAQYARENPSLQIERYLRITGLQWGILTNGRYWRLYYEKTSGNLDSYFEVDLAAILDTDAKIDFKYFYLFFRKEAFIKGSDGKNFLQHAYDESYTYAKRVEDSLERSVYKALKALAQGFFTWPTNNLKPDPGTIELVHKNCLIFLYRLLFILYADSKGALKVSKEGYEHYDINKIKFQAFTQKKAGAAAEHSPAFWNRLNDLFALIDEGSEARGIKREELYMPPYNGGLFDRGEHPFLNEKKVGDKHLAEVLELLSMDTEGEMPQSIDYSPLEIRHLGSIYEGLLEYKLRMAEEDLVAVKEKDKQVWVPRGKVEGKKVLDEVRKGGLYLVTDKGERKATGSYYTPDYIVKYIVENTLGPVVDEKLEGCATDEERKEAILSIKVLDPAMGSGHFLVEATEFLARKLSEYLPEELEEEKEIRLARREVVKRCIHGVDLNPMATELAKLSLWLSTFEPNRPLSFLDHHLRVGNSLIGADIRRLGKHPTEVESGTVPTFISDFMDKEVQEKIEIFVNMHQTIMRMAEETAGDVKAKEETYRQLARNPFRQAFKQLANLHTSYWLGNKFSKEEYYEALEAFRQFSRDQSKWEKVKEKECFKRAQELAEEKRFFHWMLTFPDIFFGTRSDNPGFDAVVGNPPYQRIQGLQAVEPLQVQYFGGRYASATRNYDICVLMAENGSALLNSTGTLGFIQPHKVFQAEFGEGFRRFVADGRRLRRIVHFNANQVFPDATTYTCLLFLSGRELDEYELAFVPELGDVGRELPAYLASRLSFVVKATSTLTAEPWVLSEAGAQDVLAKLISENTSLDLFVEKIFVGLQTSADKIYFLDMLEEHAGEVLAYSAQLLRAVRLERGVLKPVLKGEDVHRYELPVPTKWVLFPYDLTGKRPRLYTAEELKSGFPMAWHYLKENEAALRARENGRMDGPNWWGYVYPKNLNEFDKPKVITPEISYGCNMTFDEAGVAHTTKVYGFVFRESTYAEFYWLALLNSAMLWFYLKNTGYVLRGGFFTFKTNYLKPFPIRRISFTTPPDRRAALVEEAKALYSEFLGTGNGQKLLDFVHAHLAVKPEESDVVHDLLAHLAERMIEMNKEKNAEIRGFLGWLEGEVGAKVEELQNKTVIKEYYDPSRSFEDLVKTLKKNRARLALDPGRREFQERLRGEYDSSTSKLRPLLSRIENTDRLIDQVVYRLYGLTEEEIKVVEGSSR